MYNVEKNPAFRVGAKSPDDESGRRLPKWDDIFRGQNGGCLHFK
jgi:hypothetical protein